ncbi:MAG: polysaccharide biosynthesis protein [Clostridia bacterium]|nr:polysaccharide biosynthesis protein [Clostridia bacterium]
MENTKKQSLLNGAMILSVAIIAVKIISFLFRIYVTNKITFQGSGLYSVAYNIYVPIYSIALAGLPTAVSKMVASEAALGNYHNVKRLFSVSNLLFAFLGVVGTAVLLLAAYPFSKSVGQPDATLSIICIAPSLFFCCVMSGYRGYYQGLRNMNPTAVSQIFEAAGKLIFGWLFIHMVLGSALALPDVIPLTKIRISDTRSAYASAAAILGVTVGSLMGLLYLLARQRVKSDGITKALLESSPAAEERKALTRRLIKIAIPISISALVFNLTTFIDNWTVLKCLDIVLDKHFDTVAAMYPQIAEANGYLAYSPETASAFKAYLIGAYDNVLEIKNVVPTFTIAFGLSALPVLSESWTKKDMPAVHSAIESVIRLSMLIAFPAGVGMMVLSEDLLQLLFGLSVYNAPGIPYVAPILMMYGVSVCFLALAQPLVSTLQAVDRMRDPIIAMTIGAVLKVVANMVLVSIPTVNIQGAVYGSILCNIVMVVYAMVVLAKTTKLRYDFMSDFGRPLLCAVISGAAAWLTNSLFDRFLPPSGLTHIHEILSADNLACVAGVFAAVVFYVIALFLVRAIPKDDVVMLPKGDKIARFMEKHGFLR